tara:strand:+ start:2 stop:2239 length:2238 start_codon:yes stop_codon:yes gene_type:complete
MNKSFISNSFLFLFFALTLTISAYSKSIFIKGLNRLSVDDIQNLTTEDIFSNNIDDNIFNNVIKELYNSELIENLTHTQNSENYQLYIKESNFIQNIYFNGNIKVKDELLFNNISSRSNSLFNKKKVSNDLKIIKNIYLNSGFEGTTVNVISEKFSDDRINLIFNIVEKDPIYLTSIDFIGNKVFSDNYLYNLINLNVHNRYNFFKSGSNINPSLIKFDENTLLKHYKQKGFFDIKINYELKKTSFSNYFLKFYIDEGNRSIIEKVTYDFDSSNYEKINKKFENKIFKNEYYDYDLVQSHLIELENEASKRNNSNLSFNHELFLLPDGNYNIVFKQYFEKPILVNKIDILGNKITKDLTIRSKISFEPGDLIGKNKFDKTKNDLSRLKYINSVNILQVKDSEKSDIIIEINENVKTGNFLLGGSFSGDTGIGFGLNLKDDNLLGTGNQIDTSIQGNIEELKFRIKYTTTPTFNANIRNSYNIFNQENDLSNSFGYKTSSRGFGYSLQYRYDRRTSISAGVNYQYLRGTDGTNNNAYITDNLKTFDNLNFDFSIRYEDTNNFIHPTNGFKNNLRFIISPNNISDDSFYKLSFDNSVYKNFSNSENFLFITNSIGIAESLNEDKLRTINAFALGGLNFRGFAFRGIGPKDSDIYLGGNKVFTSTVGYGSSFLFDDKDNINIKLFYTTGSIWDSEYTSNNDFKLRSSAGVSFDFLTPVGPLSLSYAIPIEKESGDRVKNFNFSIGSSF